MNNVKEDNYHKVHGKSLTEWRASSSVMADLLDEKPTSWFNPNIAPLSEALQDIDLTEKDVQDASDRLSRFAAYLSVAFPELSASHGLIESELVPIPHFAQQVFPNESLLQPSQLYLKKDSHLPISGSVKARGGFYEVLYHAEQLALQAGLLHIDDDYAVLNTPAFKTFFAQYKIAVGSTGNLGLSIGIMGAALGFKTTVHMSDNAKQWKKELLRQHGVTVMEYAGDYGVAVASGREQAHADPFCYFVDDENSRTLFLGYAVAGMRLKHQLAAAHIPVDQDHPLFVYLPCGVGGAPGGITFGLKLAFGDHVHCVFAEPVAAPCMLMGVYTGLHQEMAVQDFGLHHQTIADGLAVGRPSGFIGQSMARMIDGYSTIADQQLYQYLSVMAETESIYLEPSALAGIAGVKPVLSHPSYLQMGSLHTMLNSTHILWATGGSMVPNHEMARYLSKGKASSK